MQHLSGPWEPWLSGPLFPSDRRFILQKWCCAISSLVDRGLHLVNHPGRCALGVSLQAQKEPTVAELLSAVQPCADRGGARLAAGSLTGEARTRLGISSRSSFGPRKTPRWASNASVGDGPQALNSFCKY